MLSLSKHFYRSLNQSFNETVEMLRQAQHDRLSVIINSAQLLISFLTPALPIEAYPAGISRYRRLQCVSYLLSQVPAIMPAELLKRWFYRR